MRPGPDAEPKLASSTPMVIVVPNQLLSPVEETLPAAPGDEPEPASFASVQFDVPDLLVPEIKPP